MMKIIFDCERMKYANTGLYSYCYQLGMHLRQQIRLKHEELSFFTPPQLKGIFGNEHLYMTQHSLQKFWMPSLAGYDIWHATYQNSQYLPYLNRKIKVVLTIHDLNFLYEHAQQEEKIKKYLRHLQTNINRSSAIICISEFCKADLLQHCTVGDKPIYVIHNGTNSLESPVLSHDSYKPNREFLFSIGTVNRKKNFHVLLPLVQENQDMELLIAGMPDDPDYVHYIKDTAQQQGIAEKVHVLGPVSEGEKSWYYQNCTAFMHPSLAEGFGLPVAEAMSVGKPLFLSDRTALPEIGKDVAFFFPDFNAQVMQTVFRKGMEQYRNSSMDEEIKKRGTAFCWLKAARQYLQVYHSIQAALSLH